MKVIAGLGNPGREYEATRHNIGFMVVDFLAERHRIQVNKRKFSSHIGQGTIKGVGVWLAKPQSFMNLSGKPLKAIQKELGLNSDDFIAVCDDIDLPFGNIKKKSKGGDAGHKGIRSMMKEMGTGEFYRVRVGIGRPPTGMDVSDYVLSPFFIEEKDSLQTLIEAAADKVEELLIL